MTYLSVKADPQFPPCLARRFKEADLEHDLLRRRNRHRVHHSALAGHALGNLHGLVRHHRIRGEAAEHDLPLVRRDPNAAATRAGTYFLFQVIGIEANVEVEHTDKPRIGVQQGHVGRANLFPLDVNRTVAQRENVRELGLSDDGAGKRSRNL